MSKKDEYVTGGGPFYALHPELIQSPAVRDLSSTAYRLFIEMLMAKSYFDSNEIFTFTYEQAKRCHICSGTDTFVLAKKKLIENGLIDQVVLGGMKSYATFKLSGRWRLYGTSNFTQVEYKPGVSHDNLSKR